MLISEFALLNRRAKHSPIGSHFINVSSAYNRVFSGIKAAPRPRPNSLWKPAGLSQEPEESIATFLLSKSHIRDGHFSANPFPSSFSSLFKRMLWLLWIEKSSCTPRFSCVCVAFTQFISARCILCFWVSSSRASPLKAHISKGFVGYNRRML